jgi:hypothetical protein
MMTVEQQNLAYRTVAALEGIHKAIVEFRADYLDVHGRREVNHDKPRRFEVGHSSMLARFGNKQPNEEQWRAFLLLLDAIDAVYLKKDNTYGDLYPLVAEKVQYIESLFPKEQ